MSNITCSFLYRYYWWYSSWLNLKEKDCFIPRSNLKFWKAQISLGVPFIKWTDRPGFQKYLAEFYSVCAARRKSEYRLLFCDTTKSSKTDLFSFCFYVSFLNAFAINVHDSWIFLFLTKFIRQLNNALGCTLE